MAEEIILNVNINGEEDLNKVDESLKKLGKTSNKTQTEIQKIRKELREAKSDMLGAEEGTAKYNDALARASAAQLKLKETNDKVRLGIKDFGETSKNVAQAVAGLSGGFTATIGVMGLFASENENLQKAILGVQSALAVTQGLTTFADSIDNIKDLYAGLKANMNTASTAIEDVSEVASDSADGMNDVAKTTDKATKSVGVFSGQIAKSLITMGAIMIAIAAVTYGIAKLIEWMNKVPDELKVKVDVETEAIGSLNNYIEKIKEINHLQNLLNTERIKGDKKATTEIKNNIVNILNSIRDGAGQEYLIAKNKDKWLAEFAKTENERQKKLAYNKVLFAKQADAEIIIAQEKRRQQEILLSVVDQLRQKGKTEEQIKYYIDAWKKGELGGSAVLRGFSGEVSMWNDSVENLKKTIEENKTLLNLKPYDVYDVTKTKGGSTASGVSSTTTTSDTIKGSGEVETFEKPKTVEEIFKGINKKVKEGLQERTKITERETLLRELFLAKTEKERIDKQYKLDKLDIENSNKTTGEKLIAIQELDKKYNEEYDKINKTISDKEEEKNKIFKEKSDEEREIFLRKMDMVRGYFDALGGLSAAIADIYQAEMDANNQKFDAQSRLAEDTIKNEEEKSKRLEQIENERFEANKKLFEQQKAMKIAQAWMDFASGSVGIWTAPGITSLAPFGYILAGIQQAALLATTIANTKSIASQKIDAPQKSTGVSPSVSQSAINNVLKTPVQTALTSNDENLNKVYQSNKQSSQTTIVKVTDINDVQNKVSVRDNNLSLIHI